MIYLLYLLGPDFSFNPDNQLNKVLFSVMVILYPLVDLLRVFILRIKDGQSPFVADQRHIHHSLFKRIKYAWLVDLVIIGVFNLILLITIF